MRNPAHALAAFAVSALLLGLAADVSAEPHFQTKQYTRCGTCHYSPSGGGLLTPYGRALSLVEISTWGDPETLEKERGVVKEEQPFYGFLPIQDSPIDLGLDLRPSRLEISGEGFEDTRNFWMRADLQLAFRSGGWTAYAELGRLPTDDSEFISREHWLGYQADSGFGVRVGRFLPAYGLRLADHTAFNRRDLGFDQDDQIYGVELSDAGERHLVQFAFGPGRAESLLDDDGGDAWTFAGRLQFDLARQNTLVLSGLFRAATEFSEEIALGGIAWGYAPTSRLSLWTSLDTLVTEGWGGTPAYAIYHETAFELQRGLWLKFSPQLLTAVGDVGGGESSLRLGVQWLPRPHLDLNFGWQRGSQRRSDFSVDTLLLQAHIYL